MFWNYVHMYFADVVWICDIQIKFSRSLISNINNSLNLNCKKLILSEQECQMDLIAKNEFDTGVLYYTIGTMKQMAEPPQTMAITTNWDFKKNFWLTLWNRSRAQNKMNDRKIHNAINFMTQKRKRNIFMADTFWFNNPLTNT